MISLKQIRYALAVGQTLHFKKAAEMCSVSQSALSTAISELEKQLGVAIFERNNKQVLVTKEGELFLQKAQNIKREMDDLVQLSQLSKSVLSTELSLGVIPTIGPYLLPKVLPKVRELYPDFRLQIVEDQSHVLVDMVRRGEIDVAVLALPYPTEGLLTLEFWQEDFYWVSHKDECPTQLDEITSSQMELDKLMLLKDGHCLKDHALEACQLQSVKQRSDFQSASLHTLIQMVAGKLGTTLVPQMALDQLITPQSELRALHLNEPGPHRRLAFIVRPNFVKMQDVSELIKIFKSQLKTADSPI
ncbi:LysR family transcriptional regulator [Psychrosphaera sp. B3R10]|uniref:hydrogen peroxide-inducible genes activator n=1 Tax=unclassified Psychrosphaera TaxID=2641570 RepID=UPI001C09D8DE|nr:MULTISPECIES: hydrogen peroxide-inducible genes activator [unclassified Psychrosphaera]MBU2881761.1 LysR family transcriptional regulator [Psychrosphaera sp. I2R16]MBU2990154.1 LysR family transcriptional regulator [Psychrosphaera sp. B3R10]MDO6719930.1 LysR substrate-binding domain-containing protein [Psychrosphaera sp. 1_MG-2023]